MADEAKKEEAGGGGDDAPKKKLPLWMIILIASQVVIVVGALVVFKMLSSSKHEEAAASEEEVAVEHKETGHAAEKTEPSKIKDSGSLTGPQYELQPFIVNLIDDGRGPRFLKMVIQFELEVPPGTKNPEELPVKGELDNRKNQIRDELLMLLTSKRQTDIESTDGKRILRDEIFTRVNKILVTGSVRRVFFTEFVVQ